MTPREQLALDDFKAWLFDNGIGYCGYPGCNDPWTQLAHRIPSYKYNLKKYGAQVIHHPLNLMPVCGLTHNDGMMIGKNEQVEHELVCLIRHYRDDWTEAWKELYHVGLLVWIGAHRESA